LHISRLKFFITCLLIACFVCSSGVAQEIDKSVMTEERTVGGDGMKRYFLIRHRVEPAEAPKEHGLLLILPGGSGSAEFLPFCANIITAQGTPRDFIVAQLVAPVWGKIDDSTVIWPSKAFPSKEARFTSEEFVEAVIRDVGERHPIHDGWVFTLGWSSSGHVPYSSSFQNPRIRGSFIAMSRFQPAWFENSVNAKGKRYYFWHSPDDAVCPYAESELAASFLQKAGASTLLKSYKGGHGWAPFTFYADRIKEAIEWFRASEADASKMETKIKNANKGGPPTDRRKSPTPKPSAIRTRIPHPK
jgi:predicted esterase